MKKRISALFLPLIMLFTLTACLDNGWISNSSKPVLERYSRVKHRFYICLYNTYTLFFGLNAFGEARC